MPKKTGTPLLKVAVIRGRVLGVTVLRGYARLCDLATVSKPDIYDQKNNPTGTQRDLSPEHARNAYEYVKNHELAFWPEVFLCVRIPETIRYTPSTDNPDVGTLEIYLGIASDQDAIAISRVDGNHRLHYADGTHKGFPPLEHIVSFCLAYELGHDEELVLFRDINNNQRRMNTSHLDNIEARLNTEEQLKRRDPSLYIARRLGHDLESPLYDRVYEGGKKLAGSTIPLRSLRSGINYMFSRPTKLTALDDIDARYAVIRNYFSAVKKWQPQAWQMPGKYLILRGSGLWGVCFIGADVIDRVLSRGKFDVESMVEVLRSGDDWDWSNKGAFQGLAGRGGAVKISNMVTAAFRDESGMSVKELNRRILAKK